MNNKYHELLAPAGDYEKAIYALEYGADAIYIGPKAYSLRARASNFDIDQIKKITEYAHKKNKKVYVVLNIFCHNIHLDNFPNYFKKISECQVDGIICADPFIIQKINEIDSSMEIHISTQQSITNSKAALFWKKNNATRIVLAREVNYRNLKLICKNLKNIIEIEYFIHGAVCISYSGRCTMSNNFSYRDANIGGCAHSCRWMYKTINDSKSKSLFTMSAKDMALMNDFEKLLELNISSFKIEGRMKSIYYIACIVSAYRKAINHYYKNKMIPKEVKEEILHAENRETSVGMFFGNNYKNMLLRNNKEVKQVFAFIVNNKKDDYYEITSKNYFTIEDDFEILSYKHDNFKFKIIEILDEDFNKIDFVNKPMRKYYIKININKELENMDIGRIV